MLYSFIAVPHWLNALVESKKIRYADIVKRPYRSDFDGTGLLVDICNMRDINKIFMDEDALKKALQFNSVDLENLRQEFQQWYHGADKIGYNPNAVLFSFITQQRGLKSIDKEMLREQWNQNIAYHLCVENDVLFIYPVESEENYYLSMGEVLLRTLEDILTIIDKHTNLDTMISSDFYEVYCDLVSLNI